MDTQQGGEVFSSPACTGSRVFPSSQLIIFKSLENFTKVFEQHLSYTLLRTNDGGVTVTVCQDKAGTDESIRIAVDWIRENAASVGSAPPVISEGNTVLHFNK